MLDVGETAIKNDPCKRAFDLIFSLLFLLLFSPFFVLIAILIKVTSKGPIVYRCTRLGQGGRIIHCLKFRTMRDDAKAILKQILETDPNHLQEWNTYQKIKHDPRITWIGKFLRRSSLDETLQFWNVLKGDLSVVGPRPVTLIGPPEQFLNELKAIYGTNTPTILSVKPGITGIWQVSGRNMINLREKQMMEITYIKNRSFWVDLKVVVKTIPAVLFSKGAF